MTVPLQFSDKRLVNINFSCQINVRHRNVLFKNIESVRVLVYLLDQLLPCGNRYRMSWLCRICVNRTSELIRNSLQITEYVFSWFFNIVERIVSGWNAGVNTISVIDHILFQIFDQRFLVKICVALFFLLFDLFFDLFIFILSVCFKGEILILHFLFEICKISCLCTVT